MEDFKWIFYVVVAIIYFFVKSKNKKATETPQDRSPKEPNRPIAPTSKPVTFEDLLREIQRSKAPTPKAQPKHIEPYVAPAPSQYPKYEDYDENIEEEVKELQLVDYDDRKNDNIYETYEKAKKEAFNRLSLEETMKVEDTVVRFGHFKEYDKKVAPSWTRKLAVELRNSENFKKAFIMSEILNRKYWNYLLLALIKAERHFFWLVL